MSYFVFGFINMKHLYQKEDMEKEVPELAKSIGLFTSVNDEIEAKCLKDIFELFPTHKQSDRLTFLITESQEHDTSDSLISPFDAGFDKINGKPKISDSVLKIDQLQKRIFENPNIESIQIFIVEGFDSRFKEIEVSSLEAGKKMSDLHLANPNYWPSCMFKISR
jgi:hypothetical protein